MEAHAYRGSAIGMIAPGTVVGASDVTAGGGGFFRRFMTVALFCLIGWLFAEGFSTACSVASTGFGSKSGGGKELSSSRTVD